MKEGLCGLPRVNIIFLEIRTDILYIRRLSAFEEISSKSHRNTLDFGSIDDSDRVISNSYMYYSTISDRVISV
jgi:hypothetical protein